ncbi:fumarylacetoacetate hydrolase family protein [Kitasatospora sp. NPDC056327]|uniref:fumarylacetoacetate hydrolase family protein n=1 Tax=Kitasatospora sp. NPDC056327 TaxID=3345785 RepID=UPI0035DDCCEF
MKLLTYRLPGSAGPAAPGDTAPGDATAGTGPPRLGALLDGDLVADLSALAAATGADLPGDLLELIRAGEPALATARALLGAAPRHPAAVRPLADVVLSAPLRPGKIVGVGLNYVEHVAESHRTLDTGQEPPDRPVLFCKPSTAVTGPGGPIRHNGDLTGQLDWECELAVVIGAPAFRVSEADARRHVFGYSIVNDVSARDQRRSGQWFFSKGQDSFAPFGPVVVTADEIPDPQRLDLSLRVNGELRQDSNTRHMLFGIARLIADISSGVTLEAGDVIATGSPPGVGAAMVPPCFLRPGDLVEATIEGIGTLANPVIDAR